MGLELLLDALSFVRLQDLLRGLVGVVLHLVDVGNEWFLAAYFHQWLVLVEIFWFSASSGLDILRRESGLIEEGVVLLRGDTRVLRLLTHWLRGGGALRLLLLLLRLL